MKILIEQDGFNHSYEYPQIDEKIDAEDALYRTLCLLGCMYSKDELKKAYAECDPALIL